MTHSTPIGPLLQTVFEVRYYSYSHQILPWSLKPSFNASPSSKSSYYVWQGTSWLGKGSLTVLPRRYSCRMSRRCRMLIIPDAQKLNRLNVSLFTPSLLFSKVAFFLSPGEWTTTLLRALRVLTRCRSQASRAMDHSAILRGHHWRVHGRSLPPGVDVQTEAVAEVRFARLSSTRRMLIARYRILRSFAMAAAMFMNSNSLPIALMQSLVITVPGLKWGSDDSKDAMVGRALTYLVLYSTLGMVVSLSGTGYPAPPSLRLICRCAGVTACACYPRQIQRQLRMASSTRQTALYSIGKRQRSLLHLRSTGCWNIISTTTPTSRQPWLMERSIRASQWRTLTARTRTPSSSTHSQIRRGPVNRSSWRHHLHLSGRFRQQTRAMRMMTHLNSLPDDMFQSLRRAAGSLGCDGRAIGYGRSPTRLASS